MATINAIAHLNELTKDVTDNYYLTAEVRETLDVAGIVKRLSDREIASPPPKCRPTHRQSSSSPCPPP